ncbi:protein kinase family protein [Paraburkholderia sp. BCC1885]|uniref:protein kinase family protein n=1 Tax=Paraburkholderia sp. BCC1885 TaxID=2562669 RepID=UPI0011843A2F|nr:protein kinase [Paraburkholderia sp. BCC1885]
MDNQLVKFLRQKDFVLEKRLGQGATGNTVLLFDSVINEYFACKKYEPSQQALATKLFDAFVREIKLLHQVNHPNVVRVFNYYLYPEKHLGYILMEYVKGADVGSHLLFSPEDINQIFEQTVNGFAYLEENGVLHRDIREDNILITEKGVVKIIDFGFGKRANAASDFEKSVSLSWWCDLPAEFKSSIYDFRTEVYFVGKLFEKIISDMKIEVFKHGDLLDSMCKIEPENRISSFAEVRNSVLTADFSGATFGYFEREIYQKFSQKMSEIMISIETSAKYYTDAPSVLNNLEAAYKKVMLEKDVPNSGVVLLCFVKGAMKYRTKTRFSVEDDLRKFIDMFRSVSREKQNIIIANLSNRLDAVERYSDEMDSDIPF